MRPRIALASGTRNKQTFRKLDAMITELHEAGRLDLLRALRDHQLTLRQVYDAKRSNRLPHLAAEIAGAEFAQMVQLGIEYDPQPPFDTGSPKTTPAPLVELVRATMARPDATAR